MHTAILIAAPGGLEPALVDSLRNAWGGGDAQWLSPDEAAEFPLARLPDNLASVQDDLRPGGVDIAVVPADNRRKRLLLADMDSTMIGQECIDELAAEAGVGERVSAITARAMNGELGFEGALRERVALLDGLPESIIVDVLERRITLAPGGPELLATMRAHGAHAALVSGGFTNFSGPIAERLGFHEHRANTLLAEGGRLTGGVAEPILGREAKIAALDDLTARLGLTDADVLAVGDGANDLGMLQRAGLGVALHAKPSVAAEAQVRIDRGDLTALLYIQGYSRDEFVRP
ncbi:phosphoserine phosphatase [Tranquillimonas rosea]|uniref:Phosphoserine phosphatase n=1 Tax=Tranquillimonas rosea TaxID=641238 RepID=A0A1H9U7X2_9RHOB|nr:phosphoserine phosphatase SerB [Tranquillimonas rosea]SES05338.1 phosphoserine phosphatase [Tranquillimonas rosea]